MSETYVLNLKQQRTLITSSSLQPGGSNPQGDVLTFTNYYLMRNGRPVVPVMGEFHAPRYPRQYWEEELRKMQAGGVSIVATYLFWNHIEEEEGVFDWSGDRAIRPFIETCRLLGLEVVLRCGPFVHAECRNGGLPDWLYGRGIAVRDSNESYLHHVRRFFREIGQQVAGLFFHDGGPIIGVQIENEYMHAGAPWETVYRPGMEFVPAGSSGKEHLQILKQIAIEEGLVAPLYTCTAWGGAPVPEDGFLPTHSGYAFTPWMPDTLDEQEPSAEFLFGDRHRSPYPHARETITYNPAQYPVVYSELGSGIQMTYPHRMVVPPECVQAMAVVALGSGTNWLGYYMYHGGTNPSGRHSYLNEYTAPRLSYDFQAPLGEYGQMHASYHRLRLLHLFLDTWGALLAPMTVTVPESSAQLRPDNSGELRYAVRSKDGSGFIFLNNYQDHVEMPDHENIRLRLELPDETLVLPQKQPLTLRQGVSAIFPFRFQLAQGVLLSYATAQLITTAQEAAQASYVFFAPDGVHAEFAFDRTTYQAIAVSGGTVVEEHDRGYVLAEPGHRCQIQLTALDGSALQILLLTQEQALTLWKVALGGEEYLLLADALVLKRDPGIELTWQGAGTVQLASYPPLPAALLTSEVHCSSTAEDPFAHYTLTAPERAIMPEVQQVNMQTWCLKFSADALNGLHDAFLKIDYLGDIASLYLDGHLISDSFGSELPWEIGLKRFLNPAQGHELILRISPLARHALARRYLTHKLAAHPAPEGANLLEVYSITTIAEYHASLTQ